MTGKTLGWGDVQELPPAFCIFIFVHLLLFTFWGGKGEPPPSLSPRSTEGRGAVIAVASLFAEHRLQGHGLQQLTLHGSRVWAW